MAVAPVRLRPLGQPQHPRRYADERRVITASVVTLQSVNGANMATTAPRKAWDPSPYKGWKETVENWPWTEWNEGSGAQEGWKKAGDCIACGHRMAVYQEIVYSIEPDREPTPVDAGCNCQHPHAGRPDDDRFRGCGQTAQISPAS